MLQEEEEEDGESEGEWKEGGEEFVLPDSGKMDPAVLATLPPSMQLELLVQVRRCGNGQMEMGPVACFMSILLSVLQAMPGHPPCSSFGGCPWGWFPLGLEDAMVAPRSSLFVFPFRCLAA